MVALLGYRMFKYPFPHLSHLISSPCYSQVETVFWAGSDSCKHKMSFQCVLTQKSKSSDMYPKLTILDNMIQCDCTSNIVINTYLIWYLRCYLQANLNRVMEKIFDIWLKIIWCLIYVYAFLGSFIVGWKWHNLIFFFTSDSEDDGICEENIDLLRVIR